MSNPTFVQWNTYFSSESYLFFFALKNGEGVAKSPQPSPFGVPDICNELVPGGQFLSNFSFYVGCTLIWNDCNI